MKIFLSAGEVSGDRYASKLAEELIKHQPKLELFALGGPFLRQAHVQCIDDLTQASTVGFLEPLRHLPKLLGSFRSCKYWLRENRPDIVVAVDFQGFNVPLLKYAKKIGLKTVYFIAPQEWQWGTEKGGKAVLSVTDLLLSIFQEEKTFYKNLGGNVVFVGHPLQDIMSFQETPDTLRKNLNSDEKTPILALFPGSRPQELKYLARIFLDAAKIVQTKKPSLQIVLSCVNDNYRQLLSKAIEESGATCALHTGNSHDLIRASTVSLVSSGTVTLEHALIGTPCLAAYRFSPLSFWIIKKLIGRKFRERIRFISLPNILAKKPIVPEFIQDAASPETIAEGLLRYFGDTALREKMLKDFNDLQQQFGRPGAINRAAKAILAFATK